MYGDEEDNKLKKESIATKLVENDMGLETV